MFLYSCTTHAQKWCFAVHDGSQRKHTNIEWDTFWKAIHVYLSTQFKSNYVSEMSEECDLDKSMQACRIYTDIYFDSTGNGKFYMHTELDVRIN